MQPTSRTQHRSTASAWSTASLPHPAHASRAPRLTRGGHCTQRHISSAADSSTLGGNEPRWLGMDDHEGYETDDEDLFAEPAHYGQFEGFSPESAALAFSSEAALAHGEPMHKELQQLQVRRSCVPGCSRTQTTAITCALRGAPSSCGSAPLQTHACGRR